MSFDTRVFYAVVCDYPDCGARDDMGEYRYWDDPQHALEQAREAGWSEEDDATMTARGGTERRIFCDGHAEHIVWLSDENPGPMASGDEEDARVLTLPDGERVVLEP